MRLEIVEGEGTGGAVDVPPRGHYVLGRHPAADLKIRGKGVSRRHALLMVDGQERAIQDLGSQNGTYVNGTKIAAETPLKEGDRIRIGASVLLQVTFNVDPIAAALGRLSPASPPTRIRPGKKRSLLDPEAASRDFCAGCEGSIPLESLRPRSGFLRLDDGALICKMCTSGLSSREVVAGRYRLLGRIGEGTVAIVDRALDEHAHRLVALKVMKPKDIPANALAYLEREIEILRTLDHPCIARLLDAGGEGSERFFAMELVRGDDLATVVEKRGPIPAADAALAGFAVAGALAFAHRRGVVHRDVKPSNVLVTPAGEVKLTDFGVARLSGATGGKLTKRGSRRGTPAYMSPQQARDPAAAGPVDDVYGLGATLYHAVHGAPPYGEGTPIGVILEKLDKGEPPDAFKGSVTSTSIGLADVIVRAMAMDPKQRYADGEAMRAALHDVLDLSSRVRFPG